MNSTSDDANSGDANIGDGIALDSQGRTTLRAAIEEANDHAAIDIINFNLVLNPTIALTRKLPNITGHLVIHYISNLVGEDGTPESELTITRAAGAADFRIFTKILSSVDGDGGALHLEPGPSSGDRQYGLISNCAFQFNRAGNGGAIFSKMLLTINNSAFDWNESRQTGGAVALRERADITDSTFTWNRSGTHGGALHIRHATAWTLLSNCTVSDNTALGPFGLGGGIYVGDNHIELVNVNVVRNTNFGPQPAAGVAIETGQPPPWWYFGWLTPGSQAVVNV